MNRVLWYFLIFMVGNTGIARAQDHPVTWSQQLIYQIYTRQETRTLLQKLEEISEQELYQALSTDSLKITFWINCYNACVQLNLTDSASRANKQFFRKDIFKVAGKTLSLNDIEHGMLRKSKTGRGKKVRNKWIVGDFEKKLRVNSPDYRVFFALNTGVSGDPYIYFHSPESIQRELALKMRQYTSERTEMNAIRLPIRFEPYYIQSGKDKLFAESFPGIQKIYFDKENTWVLKPRHFIGNK